MSSRTRKKSEIYVPDFVEKKAFEVEKGTGTPLGDIPYVVDKIRSIKPNNRILLVELHRLFFARPGKARTQAKNLLQFSGFPQENLEAVVNRRKAKIDKFSTALLRRLMDLLEINRSAKSFTSGKANKAELASRFLDWITVPKINPAKEAKMAVAKKTAKSKKTKPKKTKKTKKTKAQKEEEVFEETNAHDDDPPNDDAKEEKKSEVVAKKVKKVKTKKPQKVTTKRKRWFEASEYMLRGEPEGVAKRKAAKKQKRKRSGKKTENNKTAAKKAKVEEEDAPLSPELQAIKDTVFAILKVVDKTTVTMKMVRKQAEEKLGKSLVQHKAAIKIMVQEFFAG